MRYQEILESQTLIESMSFSPVKLEQTNDYPNGIWQSVFPREWIDEYDTKHPDYAKYFYGDDDGGPPSTIINHAYKPELDMNLSNRNAREIMEILGFQEDDGFFHVPINLFIETAQQWLKRNIGQLQGGKETIEHPQQMSGQNIDLSLQKQKIINDYINKRRTELSPKFKETIEKIRIRSNSSLSSEEYLEQILKDNAQRFADQWEEKEKQKYLKPTGPKIIDIGRDDGYFNKNIHRALMIAKQGKELGATHFSVG